MKTILSKILITAYFNDELTFKRGANCIIGTIIYLATGVRIRDWMPIINNLKMGLNIDEEHKRLAMEIERSLIQYNMNLDTLVQIDALYEVMPNLDALIRRIADNLEEFSQLRIAA